MTAEGVRVYTQKARVPSRFANSKTEISVAICTSEQSVGMGVESSIRCKEEIANLAATSQS